MAPIEKRGGGGLSSTVGVASSLLVLLLLLLAGSGVLAVAAPSSSSSSDEDDTCATDKEPSSSLLTVDFHPDDRRLLLYHFESTTSTQDEAKMIAESLSLGPSKAAASPQKKNDLDHDVQTFCVTATSQSLGRGTSGRQWMGAPGNVFVTIGIPIKTWMGLRDSDGGRGRTVPLTLLPLRIGDLVASRVQAVLDEECGAMTTTRQAMPPDSSPPMVTVKWPNDVLVDDRKISGTLIESAHDWFLIGIGINLAHAPDIPTSGPDHGRLAVSISDLCNDQRGSTLSRATTKDYGTALSSKAREVGVQLAYDLHGWLNHRPSSSTTSTTTPSTSAGYVSAGSIVEGWKRWLDWDMEWTMRDTTDRERVRIVDVLSDGRIQVSNVDDGSQRILVSDYFL